MTMTMFNVSVYWQGGTHQIEVAAPNPLAAKMAAINVCHNQFGGGWRIEGVSELADTSSCGEVKPRGLKEGLPG